MSVEPDSGGESKLSAWYAAYTKHQHEKSAADLLTRKGFQVLLPLYRSAQRWKDRTQIVLLPIFPCYVFVRTELGQKLDVLRTPGVFWLVESGGRACAVPDSEIDMIRRVTQSSAHFEPHPFLRSGERVRVRLGPLEGIEGILVRIKNRYRVVLTVNLLQKAIVVEVDSSVVEPLKSASGSATGPLTHSRRTA